MIAPQMRKAKKERKFLTDLKTGDRVITELKEIFDQEGEDKKGICLMMEEPYVLDMVGDTPQYLAEEYQMEYKVKFSKWNPYSTDWQFKLPYDCVMTISEPEPNLKKNYETKIAQKKELEDDTRNAED